MADVELEIIDLSTGESLGVYPLTLCTPENFELDIGNYRFIATYLKTGQALQQNISIIEGVNTPLTYEFSRATYVVTIQSSPISIPVTINGVASGNTPIMQTIQEGTHTISVPQEVAT